MRWRVVFNSWRASSKSSEAEWIIRFHYFGILNVGETSPIRPFHEVHIQTNDKDTTNNNTRSGEASA